jgi:hypothetical protein
MNNLTAIRRRLTYANVAATLAVFLSLAGGAYAALTVTGKNVKNNSLTGRDVRNGSLAGKDVKDRSLSASDFAAGQLPAGPRGPQGPIGPQGPAGPAPGSTARLVIPVDSQEKPLTEIPRLGEIRVNCNSNNGGSVYAQYQNTTDHTVDLWQDSVVNNGVNPDGREFAHIAIPSNSTGGFVNSPQDRHLVFSVGSGSGPSADVALVVVDLAVDQGAQTCAAQATTVSDPS